MILYFAYGSNTDEERLSGREFKIISHQKGYLRDYKLVFNKINYKQDNAGFANITNNKESVVEGVIYETDEQSMKNLDRWEGFYGQNNPENHYDRVEIFIEDSQGNLVKCNTYVANPKRTEEDLKPTKEYLSHLIKGAEKFDLSKSYLTFLKSIETID